MPNEDYTTTFTVEAAPADVFAAITDPRAWWSTEIEGPADVVGGEFDYHYEDVHFSRIRVIELVPGERVSWLVVDNRFPRAENPAEWTGDTLTFEIEPAAAGTGVRFTHHGLVPQYECYDGCVMGWGFYVGESLPALIATGAGLPNGTGRPRTETELRATAG